MAGPADKRKKRSALKKHDAIERIDKMVPMIIQDVETAMVLESALDVGNEVIRKLSGENRPLNLYGAHSYEAIRLGLILSLALTLAKLFDPVKLFDGRKNKQSKRRKKSERKRHHFYPALCAIAQANKMSVGIGGTRARLDTSIE